MSCLASAVPDRAFPRRGDLIVLGGFTFLYLVGTGLLAARAPLWYDELFTFHLARLPQLAELCQALAAGTDGNPPLCHLITHLCQQLLGTGELVIRLPAIAGYWVMSVCLYGFVARRCDLVYGAVALLFPLATSVYPWAYNARPYGCLLGSCGLALLTWQLAAEGHWRKLSLAGLALSLAAAFATHYYACLFWLALAIGELVRTAARRRVDWPMGLALAAGPFTLALLLPLALGAREGMAPFGFPPRWASIKGTYFFLLKATRWPVVAALLLAVLYPLLARARSVRSTPLPRHEWATALALAALPIFGVCLARWFTGYFTPRYVMPAVVGCAILLAFIVERRTAGNLVLALLLMAIFLGNFIQGGWQEYRQLARVRADIDRTCAILKGPGGTDLPVVVADPFAFLQLVHYAPAELRSRLVFLSDVEAARGHNASDPRDWALRQLRQWADLPIRDYAPFLAANRDFLLCGDGGWLRSALESGGRSCRPISAQRGLRLFHVEPALPSPSHGGFPP
jgi:hypothetical protein